MKNLIILLLLAVITLPAFGQAAGNDGYANEPGKTYRYNERSGKYEEVFIPRAQASIPNRDRVQFDVRVLYNAPADSYLAIFHLTQVGSRAGETDTLMNERINGFITELKTLNIKDEDIFTDMLTFVPVYEIEVQRKLFSKKYNEIPKGFEMKKNIHVLFKDEADLDKIVTAAAKFEIYDLVRVNYFINDVAASYKKMQEKALALVKEKENYYRQLGVELDTLYRSISEGKMISYPYESYSSYSAYSSNNLLNTSKNNKVRKARKSVTMYYKPIEYKNFDAVINPVVMKPVVQFTYNLQILYERRKSKTLKPRVQIKKQVEKQFYILKPDGNLQLLDIKR
jgi:uncharacterized protein YggE